MAKKDYTKYSDLQEETVDTRPEEQETAPIEIPKAKEKVVGVVTGCLKLNVRDQPDLESGVVCEIPCLTEVEIDEAKSTHVFHAIRTKTGREGFCMKQFIAIKQGE